jgi:hypothetical protein
MLGVASKFCLLADVDRKAKKVLFRPGETGGSDLAMTLLKTIRGSCRG